MHNGQWLIPPFFPIFIADSQLFPSSLHGECFGRQSVSSPASFSLLRTQATEKVKESVGDDMVWALSKENEKEADREKEQF